MALYVLSYDLRGSKNYKKLYDELESFGAARVLESTWCFKRARTTASGLRDHFKGFIGKDDSIFVIEVSGWATYKAINSPNSI